VGLTTVRGPWGASAQTKELTARAEDVLGATRLAKEKAGGEKKIFETSNGRGTGRGKLANRDPLTT